MAAVSTSCIAEGGRTGCSGLGGVARDHFSESKRDLKPWGKPIPVPLLRALYAPAAAGGGPNVRKARSLGDLGN